MWQEPKASPVGLHLASGVARCHDFVNAAAAAREARRQAGRKEGGGRARAKMFHRKLWE